MRITFYTSALLCALTSALVAVAASEDDAVAVSLQLRNLITERALVQQKIDHDRTYLAQISKDINASGKPSDQSFWARISLQRKYQKSEPVTKNLELLRASLRTIDTSIAATQRRLLNLYDHLIASNESLLRTTGAATINQPAFAKIVLYSYMRDRLRVRNQLFDGRVTSVRLEADDSPRDIEDKIIIVADFISKLDAAFTLASQRTTELERRRELVEQNRQFMDELRFFSDDLIVAKSYKDSPRTDVREVLLQATKDPTQSVTATSAAAAPIPEPPRVDILRDNADKRETIMGSFLNYGSDLNAQQRELGRLQALRQFLQTNLSELRHAFRATLPAAGAKR